MHEGKNLNMRALLRFGSLLTAAAALWIAGSGLASAQTINWTTQGGVNDFDNQTIAFSALTANTLTITGSGIEHNHTLPSSTFGLDLHINGVWTNIYSRTHGDTGDHLLSGFGPFTFAGGTVDGLRLTDVPQVSFAYHAMTNELFTFQNNNVTPEGDSLLLVSSGLVPLVGFGLYRRRRQRRQG